MLCIKDIRYSDLTIISSRSVPILFKHTSGVVVCVSLEITSYLNISSLMITHGYFNYVLLQQYIRLFVYHSLFILNWLPWYSYLLTSYLYLPLVPYIHSYLVYPPVDSTMLHCQQHHKYRLSI